MYKSFISDAVEQLYFFYNKPNTEHLLYDKMNALTGNRIRLTGMEEAEKLLTGTFGVKNDISSDNLIRFMEGNKADLKAFSQIQQKAEDTRAFVTFPASFNGNTTFFPMYDIFPNSDADDKDNKVMDMRHKAVIESVQSPVRVMKANISNIMESASKNRFIQLTISLGVMSPNAHFIYEVYFVWGFIFTKDTIDDAISRMSDSFEALFKRKLTPSEIAEVKEPLVAIYS